MQAAGMAPFATIALSRSQTVIVPVITPLDMFVVATAFLLVVAALFATGRGRRLVFSLIRAPDLPQLTWHRLPLPAGAGIPWAAASPARTLVSGLIRSTALPRVRRYRLQLTTAAATPRAVISQARSLVVTTPLAIGRGRRLVFSLIQAPAWRQVTWDRPQLTLGAAVPWVVSYPTPNLVVALDAEPAVAAEVAAQPRFASRMVATFPSGCILTGPADAARAKVGATVRALLDAGKAGRFLLLAPPSLTREWQRTLNEQFLTSIPRLEQGSIFDPAGRKPAWSGSPWNAFPLLVASSSLARRRDRRHELLAAAPWDVVIVDGADEARCSGRGPTRSPNELLALLQAMKSNHSWRAVFLIASSPQGLHVDTVDLLDLLGRHGLTDG
ncbi:MAG: DEAD/DEAH box helicase [Chloroflexi bacterium]|nr:MAG: DEAD/DEAH box helicase [Chloroflexota bacterium]